MKYTLTVLILTLFACTGPAGPPGAQGDPGIDGTNGSDGMDGEDGENVTAVAVWMSCATVLDLVGDDGITETYIGYTFIAYANGDLDVECESGLGSAQDDFSHTYYPNVTKGASNGGCFVGADYPPNEDGVAGGWEFTVDQGGPRATYSDISSHPMDGDFYAFTNDDCHVYIANSDGTWGDAELEDLF